MRWFLLLLCLTALVALPTVASPEILPIHDGKVVQEEREIEERSELPPAPVRGRVLLSLDLNVNASAVDPFRIVRDATTLEVVGQVTSDPVNTSYVNATELCIFLNHSIPVDNETYSVEAIARVDDTNSSLVVVFDASPTVVNASYYCTNVTNGTFYTALVEAAAGTTTTTTTTTGAAASSDAESTVTLSAGVIAAIVIASVAAAAILTIVLVLAIRPRQDRIIFYDDLGNPSRPVPAGGAQVMDPRALRRRRDELMDAQATGDFSAGRPGHRAPLRFNTKNLRLDTQNPRW